MIKATVFYYSSKLRELPTLFILVNSKVCAMSSVKLMKIAIYDKKKVKYLIATIVLTTALQTHPKIILLTFTPNMVCALIV